MKARSMRWQDWVTLFLGAWLFVMPFFGLTSLASAAGMNSIFFGSVIVVVSVAALVKELRWEEWTDFVIGLWLIFAPFVLGFATGGLVMWNSIIIGLFIAGDALWAALSAQQTEQTMPTHHASHHA